VTLLFALPFVALLLWAAACDIARMEIPNRISILLAWLYPPLAYLAGVEPVAIGLHILLGAAALAIGFILFNLGVFGGGDAKVIAGAVVWTGLPALSPFLLATCLAGGVLAAGLLLTRRFVQPAPHRPAFLNKLLDRQTGAPYAVAIAVGGFVAAPNLPLLSA